MRSEWDENVAGGDGLDGIHRSGFEIEMTETSRLARAVIQLRAAYGSQSWAEASSGWELLIRVLLVGPDAQFSAGIQEALQAPALATPERASQTSAGQFVEILQCVPRGPQKASLVRMVAEWWLNRFGNDVSPEWNDSIASDRESLRKIRGLGPATVDELLLFAANRPVFPLSRGAIRVAVRHGWLDLPLEDAEAQDYFLRGIRDAEFDGREVPLLISRVADEFCGREPRCDSCPLKSLLPPGGPLNPESV